ncbi:MAG: discoidin domain-containing protein [Verrucomicrobiota bacterium]
MKKKLILIFIPFILSVLVTSNLYSEVHKTFYVKPSSSGGKDSKSGLSWSQATTISSAKNKVKNLGNNWKGDVHVILDEGYYYYGAELKFTPEDSGQNGYKVIYRNKPNKIPVLSGGKKITGNWKSYNGWHRIANKASFRELATGKNEANKRAILARSEPALSDAVRMSKGVYRNFIRVSKSSIISKAIEGISYGHPVEMYLYTKWTTQLMRVKKIISPSSGSFAYVKMVSEDESKMLDMSGFFTNQMSYYFQNSITFLDEPGEFWKGSDYLHYKMRSGENASNLQAAYPKVETLVKIDGTNSNHVRNIEFRGIVFADSGWNHGGVVMGRQAGTYDGRVTRDKQPSLVYLEYADNIDFNFCKFTRVAATAIEFYIGCQQCDVVGNYFHKTGGNGVVLHSSAFNLDRQYIDGYNDRILNVRIAQNYFQDCAKIYEGSVPIVGVQGVGCIIANNEVEHCPYSGISWGWGWRSSLFHPLTCHSNIIQHNYIRYAMEKLTDGAGIYTLGHQGFDWVPDNIDDPSIDALQIFENRIRNINKNSGISNVDSPVSAVYFDQGTENVIYENNDQQDNKLTPGRETFYHSDGSMEPDEAYYDWGIFTADPDTNETRILRRSAGIQSPYRDAKRWNGIPAISSMNVTLNRWISASHIDGSHVYNYRPIRATDNDIMTYWSSGKNLGGVAPWYLIELKRPTKIRKIEIVPREIVTPASTLRNFEILVSQNGKNWVLFGSQGNKPSIKYEKNDKRGGDREVRTWSKSWSKATKYSYVKFQKTVVEEINFTEFRVFN